MTNRHTQIARAISTAIYKALGSPLYDVCVVDHEGSIPDNPGIFVTPSGEDEQVGTNERDDIDYQTVVIRRAHATGNDDQDGKATFRDLMRTLFHHKRITLTDGAVLYCRVSFGGYAIPSEWNRNTTSASAMRVMTLVRESRT